MEAADRPAPEVDDARSDPSKIHQICEDQEAVSDQSPDPEVVASAEVLAATPSESAVPEVGPAVMARAVRGDDHAFATVINHYDHILRSFTCQFMGDTESMDEVLTEAYVRAYRLLPAYRAETRPSTWLLRIVYHAGLHALGADGDGDGAEGGAGGRGGGGRGVVDDGGGEGGEDPGDGPGEPSVAGSPAEGARPADEAPQDTARDRPERARGAGQLALWLDEAVAQLKPERRAAVLLVDGVGADPGSAAEVLGITEDELADWVNGARPDLRAVIAAGGEGRRP